MSVTLRFAKDILRNPRQCGCKNSILKSRFNSTTKNTKSTQWKTVVGLEIHAQISSKSKLFSGSEVDFGGPVNNCVSFFDASIPGTLPVLNKRCVEAGVLAALALSCKVNKVSTFDRKHYFYADLPAGYQITQQRAPLAENGQLEFQVFTPGVHKKSYRKMSQIKQIQLEQDSGKSLHDDIDNRSLVDLNRAGIPLMELVFEPDLIDGEEAAALVKELILVLNRLGCCNGRMEEGALRVDANVSVHRPGQPLGTRTEVKNIGSIRGVARAIKYEAERQVALLETGESVHNETRSWDAIAKVTVPMRDKEAKQDYRYMPEPNLPPLILNMTSDISKDLVNVDVLKNSIPELPEETRQKLMSEYNLVSEYAIQLVREDKLLQYFLEITKDKRRNPTTVAKILIMELLTSLNSNKVDCDDCIVSAEALGEVIDFVNNSTINLVTCKEVMDILVRGSNMTPAEIIDANNWRMINKTEDIERICQEILDDNPKIVQQYKAGKTKVLNAFMGIIAKKTDRKIDMAAAGKMMKQLLKD